MTSTPTRKKIEDCTAVIVTEMETPFSLIMPKTSRRSQVVVTSPHSGRRYPSEFVAQAALSLTELRRVEDAGMDRLLTFQPLPAPLLMAEFPRSFVDLNRRPNEIDSRMFDGPVPDASPVVTRYLRSGLGVIPGKAANQQQIYDQSLPVDEADYRLRGYYHPFHCQLAELIRDAGQIGPALLVDCHSMPSDMFGVDGDIIIGNNHGTAAAHEIVNEAVTFLSREGLDVRLNTPFAGGYITQHYGRPHDGVSALQIEISRALYLDEAKLELKPGWEKLASILCRFILQMDALMTQIDAASRGR